MLLHCRGLATLNRQTLVCAATLLEQACECLTLTCALELRAALERGALLASQQNARSLVEQVRAVSRFRPHRSSVCCLEDSATSHPCGSAARRSCAHTLAGAAAARQITKARVFNWRAHPLALVATAVREPKFLLICLPQARKPLSALRTFGAMLQLRVPGSDPSSDMASGVVVQVPFRSNSCCLAVSPLCLHSSKDLHCGFVALRARCSTSTS